MKKTRRRKTKPTEWFIAQWWCCQFHWTPQYIDCRNHSRRLFTQRRRIQQSEQTNKQKQLIFIFSKNKIIIIKIINFYPPNPMYSVRVNGKVNAPSSTATPIAQADTAIATRSIFIDVAGDDDMPTSDGHSWRVYRRASTSDILLAINAITHANVYV